MRNLKPQKQIRTLDFLLYVSARDFKSISFLFLSMLKFQKKSEPCWTSDFLLSMFQLKNFFFLVCWSSREIWASVQDFGIVISMLQRVPVELSNLSVCFCPSMLNSKRILRSVFVIFCIFRIRVLFSHFQDKRNRPYDFQLEDISYFYVDHLFWWACIDGLECLSRAAVYIMKHNWPHLSGCVSKLWNNWAYFCQDIGQRTCSFRLKEIK